jgi:septal ring factor EnvC (AmiA/AmiB activator)
MSVVDLPPPAAGGSGDMADDFTGTNSEKIDRLVSRVLVMEATLRVISRAAVVFVPSIIGLFCYLVINNHTLALRMERQAEKVEQIEKRLDKFEQRLDALEKQQRETNDRLGRIEEQLRQLLARQPGKS